MTETIITETILSDNNIFETVFEHSPMAFVLIREVRDPNENLVDFEYARLNQTAKKIFDRKKPGTLLIGKKGGLQDTVLFENILFSIKTGKPSEMEFYSAPADQYFWLRITLHRLNDELLMIGLEDVTAQKIAEQKIQEHSRFVESISATLPSLVMIVDMEKQEVVYMNREVHDYLGYKIEEIRTFEQQYAIIHPDDLAHFQAYRKNILAAKDSETIQDELRIKAKDGSWQWYKVVGKVFKRNGKGLPVQYISAVLNITETKKTEAETQENANLLQSVFETSLTGIAVMKSVRNTRNRIVDFEVTLLNSYGHRILGTSIVGRKLSDVYTGEDTAALIELNRQVVEKNKTLDLETYYEGSGLKGWYHLTAAKLGDGVVVNFENITARKENEKKIREANEWLGTVLNNTSNGIMALEAVRSQSGALIDFRYLFINKKAEESVNRKNLKGKLFTKEFPGTLSSGLFERYRQVAETGQAWTDEVHINFDGMDVWALINATQMGDGILVTYLDITGRKKTEQEIVRLKDEITKKEKDKYYFIFHSIEEGFVIAELIYNPEGKPIDLLVLETNPQFERLLRIKGPSTGKTAKEIFPKAEQFWFDAFHQVVETQKSLHFENHLAELDSWFELYITPLDGCGLVIVFNDITKRKRQEAKQALLMEMTDDFSKLTNPEEIMNRIGMRLSRHLNLSACLFVDVNNELGEVAVHHSWQKGDVQGLGAQTFRLSDYLTEELQRAGRASEITVVCDIANDKRTDPETYTKNKIGAFIAVPFHRDGKWIAQLVVLDTEPRDWKEDEISLVREIADRVFPRIERARSEQALRASEACLAALVEAVPAAIAMIDPNGQLMISNREMQRFVPNNLIPSKDLDQVWRWKAWDTEGNPIEPDNFPSARALRGEEIIPGIEMLFTQEDGTEVWTQVSSVPMRDKEGQIAGTVSVITDINELKQYSDALKRNQKLLQNKELLESVFNTANMGIMVFTPHRSGQNNIKGFVCEMASKKAKEFMEKELVGYEFFDIMADAWKFMPEIRNLVETGKRFVYETHHPAEKNEKFFRHTCIKFKDGFICLCEDVTERKLAQRGNYLAQVSGGGKMGELIRTKDWSLTPLGPLETWPQSLKTAVNLMLNSQQPTWIGWGPEVTILYNDAYIPVLSRAKHPLALGLPAAQVWTEIWDFCGPLVTKAFEKGEASFVDNVRLFLFRGSYYEETYYSFSYSPIRDENGNVAGIFCPNTEVTEKALSARRLRTLSELAAHSLVEKTTTAACSSAVQTLSKNTEDLPFVLLYLNDEDGRYATLQQYSGIPDNSPLTYDKKIDLNDLSALVPFPLPEVFRTGRSKTVFVDETFLVPKGPGGQNVTRALVLPVKAPGQNNPIGILVAGVNPARKIDNDYFTFYEIVANQVATAIDNAKEAEEEKKRIDLMAEVDRAKTAFFSNVSHEFRTPLTLMLGPLEEILTHPQDMNEQARKNLSMVYNNTLRLQKLVNSLLDFSRIESGRIRASYQLTNVAELTRDLAGNFRSAIEKAGMELIVNCEEFNDEVYIDRDMWEKIVLNLISNAFKYTYKGSIEITLKKIGKHFDFSVADTGIGITPSEQKKVFERFYTVRNVQGRTQEGTGIGLSLVKELVKIHRGHIRLKSEPGQGSVFTVSIPLGKNHLPADKIVRNFSLQFKNNDPAETQKWLSSETEDLPDSAERNTGKPIVLLCDDNTDIRNYIRRLIEKDYEVMTATNGREALEQIADQRPDLVLTDIMMPVMNGNELLKEIRKNPLTATLPVIMISARAGEEARIEGIDAGADAYVVKPFTARELLSNITTVLKSTAKRKQAENNEQKFRSLFNLIPSAIITLRGPQYLVETVNTTYLKMTGKSAVQLRKQAFFELFPEWRIKLEPVLDEVLKQGHTYRHPQIQLELARDKNTEHYFSVTCQRTAPVRGESWGIVLVLDDITTRLKNEKLLDNQTLANSDLLKKQLSALEKKVGKLEKTKKELEQFNSVISHDLKEPIRKIQTYCRLMQTEIADHTPKRYLQQIDAATERMKDLVGGILDRTLLSENAPLSIPVDTEKMVEKVRQDLDLIISEKNAVIHCSNMPMIKGRPFQLHQLFYNLIENSLKLSVENARINISGIDLTNADVKKYGLDKNRKYACIQFADNGTDSDLKSIQDIFKHRDTVLTEKGIGLSICKKIVAHHHGVIDAGPGAEKGILITVVLPLA